MNPFVKKLIGFSIGPIGGAFIAFITIPLTTHFISPNEYGRASMFALFQVLIGTFLYLGIDQAYTREFHSSKNRVHLFKNALMIPLILSLVVFLLICLNAKTVSLLLFDKRDYILASVLFGLMLIFVVFERFILLSIRMQEKAVEYSVFNILIKCAILILTLIYIIFIRQDFLAVVYSTVFGQMAGDFYLIIRYRHLFNFYRFHIDRDLIKQLLKFGVPLIVAASVASLLNSIDRLALRTWSNFFEIGIFTATLKIAAVLSVVQSSFTNFWVPTAYRWYNEQKSITHFKCISDGVLLVMSLLFCCILIFKDGIIILLSPNYHDAIYIVGFLCLQPVMYTISETTTLGIVFSKKSYLNIWVSLVAVIPNLLLNLLLVPRLGAVGAAISTGVSYIFFFWGRSFFSNRNWNGFSLTKHFWVILILFTGALLNSFHLNYIVIINIGMLLLTVAVQIPTVRQLQLIYTKRDKSEWDFT
ncbi:oligosaccharide flippase family protein [Terrilactibacillus sp. BCM23-1]|uniref:Oligosaccharide flippase family protein n=1 Tax=Terrilactibacillus tamarindi TaxID=2599694 RepID=A0A6N8CP09_9BACI|nr:oligosaccharide flippase family protein [Terrilactibacillus tamarindi]